MKKKRTNPGLQVAPYQEPKSVRIQEADNGFTVSHYGPQGHVEKVAKSHAEAFRHAKEMFGVNLTTKKKTKKIV